MTKAEHNERRIDIGGCKSERRKDHDGFFHSVGTIGDSNLLRVRDRH